MVFLSIVNDFFIFEKFVKIQGKNVNVHQRNIFNISNRFFWNRAVLHVMIFDTRKDKIFENSSLEIYFAAETEPSVFRYFHLRITNVHFLSKTLRIKFLSLLKFYFYH